MSQALPPTADTLSMNANENLPQLTEQQRERVFCALFILGFVAVVLVVAALGGEAPIDSWGTDYDSCVVYNSSC